MMTEPMMTSPPLGHQRLWRWRGWQVRYSFLSPAQGTTQNPPIVLLHGFGANLNQWRYNLVPLSQQHPVYALDLLGFGGSEKAATGYGASLWSEQVRDFCEQVVGRPVVLLGHSLGALVALTTVAAYPQVACRLVMIALPSARQDLVAGWLDTLSRSVEGLVSTPLLLRPLFYWIRRPGLLRRVLRQVYVCPERVDAELVATFAAPPQQRGAARTLCYLVRSRTQADFSPSTDAMVSALQMPTLLLWGEQDRVVPNRAQDIVALSAQVTLITVEQGGHCCYDERPELVNQKILSWLNPNRADLPPAR